MLLLFLSKEFFRTVRLAVVVGDMILGDGEKAEEQFSIAIIIFDLPSSTSPVAILVRFFICDVLMRRC